MPYGITRATSQCLRAQPGHLGEVAEGDALVERRQGKWIPFALPHEGGTDAIRLMLRWYRSWRRWQRAKRADLALS